MGCATGCPLVSLSLRFSGDIEMGCETGCPPVPPHMDDTRYRQAASKWLMVANKYSISENLNS